MYKCLECDHVMDDLKKMPGFGYEIGDRLIFDTEYGCQKCGSIDVEQAEECPVCGEWTRLTELRWNGACEACKNKIVKAYNACIENSFSPEEREVLHNMQESGEL